MGFFNFPHTRTYDTDLGWIIVELNRVKELLNQYLENAVITFADPITWDITEQYTALTCVIDSDGTAYLSKQPVPAGVDITNTDYWQPIFNYNGDINKLRSNIATLSTSGGTLPGALSENSLIWYNGNLYVTTTDLPAGSQILPGVNCNSITVEEYIQAGDTKIEGDITTLQGEVTTLQGDVTTLQGDITTLQGEVTTLQGEVTTLQGDVTTLQGDVITLQGDVDNLEQIVRGIHFIYDNVADMVADAESFSVNDYAMTAGYYAGGDGGGCVYKMLDAANDFTIQAGAVYAMPICRKVYPEIFGAHAEEGYDDFTAFNKAIAYIYYLNPAIPRLNRFSRGFGGGTLYLNAKRYYLSAPIDLVGKINLAVIGEHSVASEIQCMTGAFRCDYSAASEMEGAVPWNFTLENVTFLKVGNDTTGILEMDRPYGLRVSRCRFTNITGGETRFGRGVVLSTTVDCVFTNCTFSGLQIGFRIQNYNGTYPSGVTSIVQNTTVLIRDSIALNCGTGVQVALSDAAFIQNLTLENCIVEQNDGGVAVTNNIAANASQLIIHGCYFELNNTYAINLINTALIFDESNIINRSTGDTHDKILWQGNRGNTNGWPIKNYIYLTVADTFAPTTALRATWFDAFPTFFKSPERCIDTLNHFLTMTGITVAGWWNIISSSNHPRGTMIVEGSGVYGVFNVTMSASSMTSTPIGTPSGVTVRSDGALVTSVAANQKFIW